MKIKKILIRLLDKKIVPFKIIKLLIKLAGWKNSITINLFHPKFSLEEIETIKKWDLESIKTLHKKFKPPMKCKYDFDSLKNRVFFRYHDLISVGIKLKGKKILDLGAGTGESLIFAKNFGIAKATGLDYSAKKFNNFIKNNQRLINPSNLEIINYVEADASKQIFKNNSFDLIVTNSSFEHFENPTSVLKNMWQMCKSDGYIHIRFRPLFYSPRGAHRYGYTGIPYIQNLYSNHVVYEFFYNFLKIPHRNNRYTGEKISPTDVYPEMNKWKCKQFEEHFTKNNDWQVIKYEKIYEKSFKWFVKIFPERFSQFSDEDLFICGLNVVLKCKK